MSVAVAHDEHQSDDGELLRLLRDAAATFARRGGIERSRALRATRPGMDAAVWTQMAEQGWLGIIIPEEFGGQGLGFARDGRRGRGARQDAEPGAGGRFVGAVGKPPARERQ